ncbi:MAG: ATP-binding protein [Bacteroidia bacterium]|nr:ATP-binding protein [Bacteroidia bacterium]
MSVNHTEAKEILSLTHNLFRALTFLEEVIHLRLQDHFTKREHSSSQPAFQLPNFQLDASQDPFTRFVVQSQLSVEELIMTMLALAAHIKPSFFERIVAEYLPDGGDFPAFGGAKGQNYRHILPTVGTALFILAGEDYERRLALMDLFDGQSYLLGSKIIYTEEVKRGEPKMSAKLLMDEDYVELFTRGRIVIPQLSSSFPAQVLRTQLEWHDLVLTHETKNQLEEIEVWVRNNHTLMNELNMSHKFKPGYRALFYGPPGTGKTLASSLIGKYTGQEVLRIDLSQVISKYIGETEKNLANLFDKAENKGWCLFFDEADAVFGKRTNTKEAKDRYSNQEVAYLLQRIESYNGLVIMATNFKSNVDEAFLRRFNSVIHFPLPGPKERLQIWQKAFPEELDFENDELLQELAHSFELSGSAIMNVAQFACLQALEKGNMVLSKELLVQGIQKEFQKET